MDLLHPEESAEQLGSTLEAYSPTERGVDFSHAVSIRESTLARARSAAEVLQQGSGIQNDVVGDLSVSQELQEQLQENLRQLSKGQDMAVVLARLKLEVESVTQLVQQEENKTGETYNQLQEQLRQLAFLQSSAQKQLADVIIAEIQSGAEAMSQAIVGPEFIHICNQELFSQKVLPVLTSLVEAGSLSEQNVAEVVKSLTLILHEGRENPELVVDAELYLERIDSHHDLARLRQNLSASSNVAADSYYSQLTDIILQGAADHQIQQFSKLSQINEEDSKDVRLHFSTALQKLQGAERWPIICQQLLEHNVVIKEEVEFTERQLIEALMDYFSYPENRYDDETSRIVKALENLNNPVCLSDLLRLLQKQFNSDKKNLLAGVAQRIGSGCKPEELDRVLQDLPEDEKKILQIFLDQQSYLNRFYHHNDYDYFGVCHQLEKREKLVPMERYCKALEEDGVDQGQLKEFYNLSAVPMSTTTLPLLQHAAVLCEEDPRQVVDTYFDELTKYVGVYYPEWLEIVPALAETLGVDTAAVWQRIDVKFREKHSLQSPEHFGALDNALDGCRKVAAFTGRTLPEIIQQYIPLHRVSMNDEYFLHNCELLAAELSLSPLELIRQIVQKKVQKNPGNLSGLICNRVDTQAQQLVHQAVVSLYEEAREAGDAHVAQSYVYLLLTLAREYAWRERIADHKITLSQDEQQDVDDLASIRNTMREQFERVQEDSPEDPVMQYMAYQGFHKLRAINLDRLHGVMQLDTEQAQNKIQTFRPFKNSTVEAPFWADKAQSLFPELLVIADPALDRVLSNPTKLGSMRDRILSELHEYVGSRFAEDGASPEVVAREVLQKLELVRRTFESSDSSLLERRSLFLDGYDLDDCHEPAFNQEVSSRIQSGQTERSVIQETVLADFEELLIESGSYSQERYYQKQLARADISDSERERLQETVSLMQQRRAHADQHNREVYAAMATATDTNAFMDVVVPLSSVTQVGPPGVTGSILEQAALCDGLLGESAYNQEENLAAHVSVTRLYDGALEQLRSSSVFAERIPSFGNPHIARVQALVNRVYGDVTGWKHQPYGRGGSADGYFDMGPGHQCVYLGLPSTEITSIIVSHRDAAEEQKKAVAANGFFIPVVTESAEIMLSPEEFDRMKPFYCGLQRLGYPEAVSNNAYAYYQELSGIQGSKHRIILEKAVAEVTQQLEQGQPSVDLAVLVDFLQANDLNTRPLSWYEEQDFSTLFEEINSNTAAKNRWRSRDLLFTHPQPEQWKAPQSTDESMAAASKLSQRSNGFLDAFFAEQLTVLPEEERTEFEQKAQRQLRKLLFREAITLVDEEVRIDLPTLEEAATFFTEQKLAVLAKVWEQVWQELAGSFSDAVLAEFKQQLVPVITGSGGRGEMSLASDLDYALLVDDAQFDSETRMKRVEEIQDFVSGSLEPKMNDLFKQLGIRPDAGLAKEARTALTLRSRMREFEIDLTKNRQEEEPTEVINYRALFERDNALVGSCKEDLLVHNPTAHLLDSFVLHDLEVGSGKKSFAAEFESLYESAASGQLLERIKESLQRVLVFKLNHLLFMAIEQGGIGPEEIAGLPSQTPELIQFLEAHNVLTSQEAGVSLELWAVAYKLRFLGEIFSKEAEQDGLHKVKNAQFRLDDLSLRERARLFEVLRIFKEQVLYK